MEKQDVAQIIITALIFAIVFHMFDAIMGGIWWLIKLIIVVKTGESNV